MSLNPQTVAARLDEIDADLAARMPALERAAQSWFIGKRNRERDRASEFLSCNGTVAERSAHADLVTATIAAESEAEYEALRAVVRVLEARASIGMALLKSYGRGA